MFLYIFTERSVYKFTHFTTVDTGVKITPGLIFWRKNHSGISTSLLVLIFTPLAELT